MDKQLKRGLIVIIGVLIILSAFFIAKGNLTGRIIGTGNIIYYGKEPSNILYVSINNCTNEEFEIPKDYIDRGSFKIGYFCDSLSEGLFYAKDYRNNKIIKGWLNLGTIDNSSLFVFTNVTCGENFNYSTECPENYPISGGRIYVGNNTNCDSTQAINYQGNKLYNGWLELCTKDKSAIFITASYGSGGTSTFKEDVCPSNYSLQGVFDIKNEATCNMTGGCAVDYLNRDIDKGWFAFCSKQTKIDSSDKKIEEDSEKIPQNISDNKNPEKSIFDNNLLFILLGSILILVVFFIGWSFGKKAK